MADKLPAKTDGADALEETLSRLSKKTGVKATIILDRKSGAILKTSGQISQIRPARGSNAPGLPSSGSGSFSGDVNNGTPGEASGAEELASMVWNFIRAAATVVQEMDGEDELRLLRLRTKKQELVIVPDPNYLLIVVHDTPPA